MNIPEDIRNRICKQFENSYMGGFKKDGAEYGYSLALPKIDKIEELEKKVEEQAKEIERLKERYFTPDQIRMIEEAAYDAGCQSCQF